jgi:hypothetical protein
MAPRLENNAISNLYKNPFQSIIDEIKTYDLSKLDAETLALVLKNATVEGTKTKAVREYAKNYKLMCLMAPILFGCPCGRNL